jgi:N-acetylneuraminate synthase
MEKNVSAPKFIAEISANHAGSFERAKNLVNAAASAGADFVKFQTFTADSMTLNLDKFRVSDNHSLWGSRRLYDLYKEAATPYEWHKELFKLARSLAIEPFSTPFDFSAVDLLQSLDCSMYKIASLEVVDIPLIRYVAQTGKPIVISTGASTLTEITDAVTEFRKSSQAKITLLVCTSAYPADPKDANLHRMKTLRERFDCEVGLSDHSKGINVSLAAVALGANLIERHINFDDDVSTLDSEFSLSPEEFSELSARSKIIFDALGSEKWSNADSESESKRLRRSLYLVKSVVKGDKVDANNVKSIRPNGGLAPKFFYQIEGRKFKMDFDVGTPLKLDMVE